MSQIKVDSDLLKNNIAMITACQGNNIDHFTIREVKTLAWLMAYENIEMTNSQVSTDEVNDNALGLLVKFVTDTEDYDHFSEGMDFLTSRLPEFQKENAIEAHQIWMMLSLIDVMVANKSLTQDLAELDA